MGADQQRRRAVFLDRDGVINRNVLNTRTGKHEAPLSAAELSLLPGATEAMRALQDAGFLLFLVSNQPNYAKRKSTLEELAAIDAKLQRELREERVDFAAVYYCLHHPQGDVTGYSGPCACRKPAPYFLLRARREFHLNLDESWMVGDRVTDILCGRAAGVRTILIDASETSGEVGADRVAKNLAAAADYILAATTERSLELQVESL